MVWWGLDALQLHTQHRPRVCEEAVTQDWAVRRVHRVQQHAAGPVAVEHPWRRSLSTTARATSAAGQRHLSSTS